MVLRNPERGKRVRVGGLLWVSSRLYPLVKAACPNHPLLRETRREVLRDILDVARRHALAGDGAVASTPPLVGPFAVHPGLDYRRGATSRSTSTPRPTHSSACTRG